MLVRLRGAGYTDLALSHASLLSHIDPNGTRLTTIAERAEMTKQSASQIVAELEAAGYVVRRREAGDGRARNFRLSPRGEVCRRDLMRIILEIENALVSGVGPGAASSFCLTLSRLPELLQVSPSQRNAP